MNTQHDWITTPVTENMLRGFLDVEATQNGLLPHRLPARARRQIPDDQLAMAEAQPSGVRLVFRTRATTVELDTVPTKRLYRGLPAPADGVYDLLVDGRLADQATVTGGNVHLIDMATQSFELQEGLAGTARFTDLPARDKDVEIWLPHTEITELVALRTDARSSLHRPAAAGLAAPRQFHQPWLERQAPHRRLAGAGRGPGRCGADQHGVRRQCAARPFTAPRDA